MTSPIQSLAATGTKVWLDSVDPDLVRRNRDWGVTGATSNPVIISELARGGRFDAIIERMLRDGWDDSAIAWELADRLVSDAQNVFLPVWHATGGNDGYVSLEVDPLVEDASLGPPPSERAARYAELGRRWGTGHCNRMIK